MYANTTLGHVRTSCKAMCAGDEAAEHTAEIGMEVINVNNAGTVLHSIFY